MMVSPASMVGRVLGQYLLVQQIGAGGMGIVYRAHDQRLERDVALKVLAPGLLNDEASRKRFRNEALTLSRFSHPNAAHVYDFNTQDGLDFLAMEFVDGTVLSDLIAKGPLPEDQLLDIGRQVASTLHDAHEAGIVHCDIKPANLILTVKGQMKLLDFGLAQIVRLQEFEGTRSWGDYSSLQGTLRYMAPEQLGGKPCTVATDIYSLGVVLYQSATGRLPFDGNTPAALMHDILNKTPQPPRKLRPHLSPRTQDIILRCLEKQPERRYGSAAELEAVLSGRSTAPVRLPLRRRLAGLWKPLVAAVVLIAVVVGLVLHFHRRPSATAQAAVKRLAVLPMISAGSSPEAAAFDNGLVETLTSRLARLSGQQPLVVVPTSEMRERNVTSFEQANREFGVNLGLQLNVQRSGDLVRVNYALIDLKQHRQQDGDTITASANDPFGLEDRVSESVVNALKLKLQPGEQVRLLAAAGTQQPVAHDYYLQGRGYLQDFTKPANIDSAIAEFKRAVEQDSNYALAYAGLGEAYLRKYDTTHQTELIAGSRHACEKAVSLQPDASAGHYCLALITSSTGDYQTAVEQYRRAVELDPSSDRAYTGLASAYQEMGNSPAAEATLNEAIRARPNDWLPYNALGNYYFKQGDFSHAAEMFRQVIVLVPDGISGYTNLGITLLQQGKYQEAIPYLQRSVQVQATGENTSNLANAYFFLHNYTQAARTFEQSVAISPDDYELWGNLGDAYYWAPGERHKAKPAYEKAIQLGVKQLSVNPKDRDAMAYVGQYYAMLGKPAQALDYLHQAERRGPMDAGLLSTEAIVYVQIGQPERALGALEKAVAAGLPKSSLRDTPNFDTLRSSPRFTRLLAGS